MRILEKLRSENRTLLKMLMEMIVENNMVCSQEEFMIAMEKKYGVEPGATDEGVQRMKVLEMAAKRRSGRGQPFTKKIIEGL